MLFSARSMREGHQPNGPSVAAPTILTDFLAALANSCCALASGDNAGMREHQFNLTHGCPTHPLAFSMNTGP